MSEKTSRFTLKCPAPFLGVPLNIDAAGNVTSHGYVSVPSIAAVVPVNHRGSEVCHVFLQGDRSPVVVQASVEDTMRAIAQTRSL